MHLPSAEEVANNTALAVAQTHKIEQNQVQNVVLFDLLHLRNNKGGAVGNILCRFVLA